MRIPENRIRHMRNLELPVSMKSARNDVTGALRTNDGLRKSHISNDSVISKSYILLHLLFYPPEEQCRGKKNLSFG